jgi:hypothetical protein
MNMRRLAGLVLAIGLLMMPTTVGAQMRGMGRITGTVTDGSGAPLADVKITARMAGFSGVIDATSDDHGTWALGGIARGEWDVVFEKSGYAPTRAKVTLQAELSRIPPIAITLRKAS